MLGQVSKQRAPWEGRVELGQRIVAVDASQPPVVVLTFADGYVATVNLQRLLDVGKVFEPLRDPNLFRTAHPGSIGSSLEWIGPDGEIDLCADSLRMEAEGIWNPETQEWKV
jgi:hypothetical protein